MGRLVRKRPCPCGSGRLAVDCCGRFRRLTERETATAYLARQVRPARDLLGPFSPAAVEALQSEAATVPAFSATITASLTGSERLRREVHKLASIARRAGNAASAEAAMRGAAPLSDGPVVRAAVARAFVALRESGELDEHVAAAAIIDLTHDHSTVAQSALVEAAATMMGRAAPTITASTNATSITAPATAR